jgi:hypothetical protein
MILLKYEFVQVNRTAFKAKTATEAADHAAYYRHLTWQERLRIVNS